MKEFRLEDLTKEELIEMIRHRYPVRISQRDIAFAIWERLSDQGHALYVEGMALQEKAKGIKNPGKSQMMRARGRVVYEMGSQRYARADRIWKECIEPEYASKSEAA